MKKRVISAIICVLLSVSLLSGGAWADPMIADTLLNGSEFYVNKADRTGVVASSDANEENANAYYRNGTLYLNGLNVSNSTATMGGVGGVGYAIQDHEALTIDLKGVNIVTVGEARTSHSAAIYVTGALTFTGSGSITATGDGVSGESCGINATSITASGSAKVSGVGGEGQFSAGIKTTGSVTASDNAVIRGTGDNGRSSSIGVHSQGAINASDDAEITGTSRTSDMYSIGISADNGISASGNAQITGTGDSAEQGSYGLSVIEDTSASDNATVSGTGGDCTEINSVSFGIISTGETKASGNAEITGTGGTADIASTGIQSQDKMDASDSAKITGVGSSAVSESVGIYAMNEMALSGTAAISGTGGTAAENSTGVRVNSISDDKALSVSGGTLTATGGNGSEASRGIQVFSGSIDFSDGTIIAKADRKSKAPAAVSADAALTLPESYYWRTSTTAAFGTYPTMAFLLSASDTYVELRTKLPPTNESKALIVYTVEKTDGGFFVKADFGAFLGIAVDGEEVDEDNYTVESKDGKTLVTFTEAYLKTLSKGEHILRIVFTDGYGEIKFTVG